MLFVVGALGRDEVWDEGRGGFAPAIEGVWVDAGVDGGAAFGETLLGDEAADEGSDFRIVGGVQRMDR